MPSARWIPALVCASMIAACGSTRAKPGPPPLSEAQQTLNELGKKEYVAICAACHHPIGYGVAGSGPPLVDSDWLRGPDERLIT